MNKHEKGIKLLILALALIGCGRESDPSYPAVYKHITINTVPNYQVESLAKMPYCARSCDVLEVRYVGKFYCLQYSTQFQPLISEVICQVN